MFIHKRGNCPRAQIEHTVTHKKAFYHKTLLIVGISILNTSDAPLLLRSGKTYVKQALPAPQDVLADVQNSSMPARDRASEWKLVAFQTEDWGDEGLLLKAGEVEYLSYTFFIDASVRTVSIYTYVPCVERSGFRLFRQRRQRGWSQTTLYAC